MNTLQSHHAPKPPGVPLRDGEHYGHLLVRTIWYIVASTILTLLVTMAIMFIVVRPENPELTARALIGLEHSAKIPGVKDASRANLGREDIMMSRTFLRDVVQNLSLQLSTIPYARGEKFDSVRIDSSAPCGTYCVRTDLEKNDRFVIYYYDTTAISVPVLGFLPGSNSRIVASGNWAADMPVQLPGMYLKFNRSIRAHPRAFKFKVVDIRVAVETVFRNLTIKRADPDKGINYIAVLVANRDYALGAAEANAIADAFIEKNSSFSLSRTHGIVESLEKQLRLAQSNLNFAETKMRDFRSQNPQVGLNLQVQQTVSSLAQLDNGIQNMSSDIINAQHLKSAFWEADSSRRLQIAGEITELLSSHSVPSGKSLGEELARLTVQRNELNATYGVEHPLVLENNRALVNIIGLISSALDEFTSRTQSHLSKKHQSVQQLSSTLRQLPALEMQMGELERDRKIYADIYSAVLASYNQAKVSDAVETADFYVMDYAVAALPPPANRSTVLFLCIFIALVAGFGPVLLYDLLDKSVRSQQQLARITGNLVLEAVPFFITIDENNREEKTNSHPLITVPCDPVFTREIFDSMLLKIKLRLAESSDHSIVVSSFEDNCGKSTISANLAIAMALRGHRTLLVDGDLRRGTVGEIFGLGESGGLAELLSKTDVLTDETCMRSIVETKIPNLYVVPCGHEPHNPGALLSGHRMEEFRRFCGKHVAFVVMDTPPLGVVSDAMVFQKLFAHYLFVVRSGKTNVTELVNRINEFDQLPDKIVGYVLNMASHDAVGTYRRYSKYYVNQRPFIEKKKNSPFVMKRKSVVWFPAVMLATASLIGLGIASVMIFPILPERSVPAGISSPAVEPWPDQSNDRPELPTIEESLSVPTVATPQPEIKTPAAPRHSRSLSGSSRNEQTGAKNRVAEVPNTVSNAGVSDTSNQAAIRPTTVDSMESPLATLQEIRIKFAQGDRTGLDSIFKRPAPNDGEYYVWMVRYLCETGQWQKALTLVEKVLTTPSHTLSGDQLTQEYFFYKAKCLGVGFAMESTPARGFAAMEAWFYVKYQLRGSPRESRYLYAENEIRSINHKVNGK